MEEIGHNLNQDKALVQTQGMILTIGQELIGSNHQEGDRSPLTMIDRMHNQGTTHFYP